MRDLTLYAHHDPRSFCHAVLARFALGLRDAGPANEAVDLHAIHFDPVYSDRGGPVWVDDSAPDDVLTHCLAGRTPLPTRARALIVQTKIRDEASYVAGLKTAMEALVGEYALRHPGIKRAEREYFHAVHGAADATGRAHPERDHAPGREV